MYVYIYINILRGRYVKLSHHNCHMIKMKVDSSIVTSRLRHVQEMNDTYARWRQTISLDMPQYISLLLYRYHYHFNILLLNSTAPCWLSAHDSQGLLDNSDSLSNRPYWKMAADLIFFCMHINWPLWPRFRVKILLNFLHDNEVIRPIYMHMKEY